MQNCCPMSWLVFSRQTYAVVAPSKPNVSHGLLHTVALLVSNRAMVRHRCKAVLTLILSAEWLT